MTQTSAMPAPPAHGPATPHHRPPRALHRAFNRLLTLLFVLAIALPLIGTPLGWDFIHTSAENRAMAPLPRLPHTHKELRKYSDAFFAWFADHFGFRNTLIRGLARARYATVGPTHTSKLIVGADENWLFLRPRDAAAMGNADGTPGVSGDMAFRLERGLMPFTEKDLQAWQDCLEKRYHYLAGQGIPYLVVIPPEKQAIYPEHLPPLLHTPPLDRPTRLDELLAWMKAKKSPVPILDLRPALLAAKKEVGEVYRRTDSHWNDEGAYVGYREILSALRPLLPADRYPDFFPEPRTAYTVTDGGMVGADLSALLSLEDRIQEPWLTLTRIEPTRANQWEETWPGPGPLTSTVVYTSLDNPRLPTLYLARDSFTTAVMPFLKDSFRRICSPLHHILDERLIEKEKPDVVVSEFVERKLYFPAPIDTESIDKTPLPGH
jgi:hypothetical protein